MKINIYTLEYCNNCSIFKRLLLNSQIQQRIPCLIHRAEDNSQICDELESITGSQLYPMVVIENNNAVKEIVFLAESYDRLHAGVSVVNNIKLFPVYNVERIISYLEDK